MFAGSHLGNLIFLAEEIFEQLLGQLLTARSANADQGQIDGFAFVRAGATH